jgi:hypothetical protein
MISRKSYLSPRKIEKYILNKNFNLSLVLYTKNKKYGIIKILIKNNNYLQNRGYGGMVDATDLKSVDL